MDLRDIPSHMAAQLRAVLPSATLAGYQRFLDHMVHYTRGSEARLLHAAEHTDADHRAYFAELAADEAHHYKLAEADLAAFDLTPSPTAPSSVVEFDRAWRTWSTAGWLGALYALESVAVHIAPDAQLHLGRLGITKQQARFIFVHLTADVEHGAQAVAQLEALATEHAAVLAAAQTAGAFWAELHIDAFSARSSDASA